MASQPVLTVKLHGFPLSVCGEVQRPRSPVLRSVRIVPHWPVLDSGMTAPWNGSDGKTVQGTMSTSVSYNRPASLFQGSDYKLFYAAKIRSSSLSLRIPYVGVWVGWEFPQDLYGNEITK